MALRRSRLPGGAARGHRLGDAHWFPATAASGWKYWAIVQPAKLVGHAVVKELSIKYAKQGVTSQWFTDPNDAMDWLIKQRKSAAA